MSKLLEITVENFTKHEGELVNWDAATCDKSNNRYKGIPGIIQAPWNVVVNQKSIALLTNGFVKLIKEKPMTKQEIHKQLHDKWIQLNNIKVGDKVRVLRKAESFENGWNGYWVREMDKFIGKVLTVNKIEEEISTKESLYYPYFVLEKVEVEEEKFYKIGSRFSRKGVEYVLAKVHTSDSGRGDRLHLIQLNDGNNGVAGESWSIGVECWDYQKIPLKQLNTLFSIHINEFKLIT